MPRSQSRSRRLQTAARWPTGIVLTDGGICGRLTPVGRWDWPGALPHDGVPALPDGTNLEALQDADDGVGPLMHRLYRVRIRTSPLTPEALMSRMTSDVDAVAPSEFATFQKLRGQQNTMRVGDEYVVRMAGPWDGPVRVVDKTPLSFRLAT